MSERPVILISSANDAQSTGDAPFNGGVKLYALWVKLLRQHGYPAYVVTYDGKYTEWLMDHPLPFLSIAEAAALKASRQDIRWMTGWLWSKAFLDLAADDGIYFFDAELAFTAGVQRNLLALWLPSMRKIATHSRTQQAWYGATFGLMPMFIPEWSDTKHWHPRPECRVPNRIGFMDEGAETLNDIDLIRLGCKANGLTPEFVQISGSEAQVLEQMQSCDLFLGLGRGKHPLFGEGCNRSGQEAMHAGCVVLMYDQHGNREYLLNDYNGYLVPVERTDLLTKRIVRLLNFPILKENLRWRSVDFAVNYFTPEKRWNAVAEFLDLATERV